MAKYVSQESKQWCLDSLYEILTELRKREARVLDVGRKTQIQQQIIRLVDNIEIAKKGIQVNGVR
jgi:hypothetical protein